MSFTTDWLALREPADRAARDPAMLAVAAAAALRAAGGAPPVVVDLGCGTGSTARAMADALPQARWRLVDADPVLLERAAASTGGTAHLMDLADVAGLPLAGAHLVTASALLDLMPSDWLEALAHRLAAAGLGFYAALNYDGIMTWDPPLAGDGPVTEAFNRHQRSDKGLGPALGPESTDVSARILSRAGLSVHRAPSPWRLGPDSAALQSALMDGIAQAAAEAGCPEASDWRRAQAAAPGDCVIGHEDLLALPPG